MKVNGCASLVQCHQPSVSQTHIATYRETLMHWWDIDSDLLEIDT